MFSWGKGSKAGTGESAASSKAAPKARGSKKPVKPEASANSVALLTELEDGRQVLWELEQSSLRVLEDQASLPARPLLSFSRRDLRIQARKAIPDKAAAGLAMEELAEDARVVNASKRLGVVFGTPSDRVKRSRPAKLVPGGLLVDHLRANAGLVDSEDVAVLHLEGGGRDLAMLYAFNRDGDLLGSQITVNPDDISLVIAQFVAEQRLDPDTTRVLTFQNRDVLEMAPKLGAYPSEAMLLGVPVTKVLNGAALVALAGAVGTVAWAGQAYTAKESATRALASAKATKAKAMETADQLLMSSVTSFARTQSLDSAKAVELAHSVWVPGSTVVLEAAGQTVKLNVSLPILGSVKTSANGGASVPQEPGVIQALLDKSAPDGCTKSPVSFTGGLRAVQVVFECQTPPGPLPGYSLN